MGRSIADPGRSQHAETTLRVGSGRWAGPRGGGRWEMTHSLFTKIKWACWREPMRSSGSRQSVVITMASPPRSARAPSSCGTGCRRGQSIIIIVIDEISPSSSESCKLRTVGSLFLTYLIAQKLELIIQKEDLIIVKVIGQTCLFLSKYLIHWTSGEEK